MTDAPEPAGGSSTANMFPLLLVLASIAMLPLLYFGFHRDLGVVAIGGLMVLSLFLISRRLRRRTLLLAGVAVAVVAAGLEVVVVISFAHNPTTLVFGTLFLAFGAWLVMTNYRTARREEDEVKR